MHTHSVIASDGDEMVLVSDPSLSPEELDALRALQRRGVPIVAWQHRTIVQDRFPSPDIHAALSKAGISSLSLSDALGEREDEDVEQEVIRWLKAFGRRPLDEGASFREAFRYGPLVLWWWAELYLYHETPLRLVVRDVEALHRLCERTKPARLTLVRPVRRLEAAARRFVPEVRVLGPTEGAPLTAFKTASRSALDLLKMMGTGAKSLARARPSPVDGPPSHPRVFFLTHASMWRAKRVAGSDDAELSEMYFDSILPAVSDQAIPIVVAFGPPTPFKKRGLFAVLAELLELDEHGAPYRTIRRYFPFSLSLRAARGFPAAVASWRRFRALAAVEPALSHHGVSLGPEALPCFRDTFFRQFPWAIRTYVEVESVLRLERPDVLVLYAESSGLGRAAVTAARACGVPSFAVQHGIMYPQYYSHEHEADELAGNQAGEAVPIPDRTAVFGSLARDLLVQRGAYPEERIVITGSPKFDALVESARAFDAGKFRSAIGVPQSAKLVVLATRFSAIAPHFGELVEAVERLEGVWLYVKPHQAESADPYREILTKSSSTRTRILPAETNLLEVLFASDGLITVDSFASSEALVLGRPVLVVNLPNNLAPLVERGCALGVRRGESIEAGLRKLLFDGEAARELDAQRKAYLQEFAYGADGRSTERIVTAILETATRENSSTGR